VPFEEAFAVIGGYCLGEEGHRWAKPGLSVGDAPDDLRRGPFAYRTYDCIPAAPTCRLEPIDVLVADGLNAQMRAKDIAAVLAVAGDVSDQLARIDEDGTSFTDLARDQVATPPTQASDAAWPVWRAWTILMGVAGIDLARTHKILHHKRPNTFPLIDNQTLGLLSGPQSAWATIYDDLASARPSWTRLEAAVTDLLVSHDGAPITCLRMHDILLWARATGRWDTARDYGAQYSPQC